MNTEANRKQKTSKQRKLNFLQDGYLGFSQFFDFDTQNFEKNYLFRKIAVKFKIFNKPGIICIGPTYE